ncbi:hypothetical protein OCU04_005630 [Sclerotinia nivalis]|uniref:Uncharacterized protein n=1 Tax=Sclerotinia nivalis TaxID=352851 RepID=A0A9X0API4_9HELO|nr:hypothetical protein OCU04_005630 [Sclerotinia nivalis]
MGMEIHHQRRNTDKQTRKEQEGEHVEARERFRSKGTHSLTSMRHINTRRRLFMQEGGEEEEEEDNHNNTFESDFGCNFEGTAEEEQGMDVLANYLASYTKKICGVLEESKVHLKTMV